jgi:hypothetical protein
MQSLRGLQRSDFSAPMRQMHGSERILPDVESPSRAARNYLRAKLKAK